jgi:hypothetical protein
VSVANHDYWQAYIRDIADRMALKDWTILLSDEPADEESEATTFLTNGRKVAKVYLSSKWEGRTPEEQRHTVVHEMVHPHLYPLTNMGEDDIEPLIGKAAHTLWQASFRRELEYAVDGLADAIAPLMPLPEPPKDKQ